jgi:hypothetical protein
MAKVAAALSIIRAWMMFKFEKLSRRDTNLFPVVYGNKKKKKMYIKMVESLVYP